MTDRSEAVAELIERIAVEEGQHGPSMLRRLHEAGLALRPEREEAGLRASAIQPRTIATTGHLSALAAPSVAGCSDDCPWRAMPGKHIHALDGSVYGESTALGAEPARPTAEGLDEAFASVIEAMPWKRWTLSLDGDWEDGWVASATSRPFAARGIEVTTEGQGWGADRGGLSTPAAALLALAARLTEAEAET